MAGDSAEVNFVEMLRELAGSVKELRQEWLVIDKKRNRHMEQLSKELYDAVQIIKSNKALLESQQSEINQLHQKIHSRDRVIEKLRFQCDELSADSLRIQLQQSNSQIRIRDFPEEENFDAWLVQETEMKKELQETVDCIQRRDSVFSKRNNLPRDIIITCRNKMARDEILYKLDQKIRTFNDKVVKVIRELPVKIRQSRKEYKEFAARLRQKQIKYRWILPEGINFLFKSQRYNINSKEGIQKFLLEHRKEFRDASPDIENFEVPQRILKSLKESQDQRKYKFKNNAKSAVLKEGEVDLIKEEKFVVRKNARSEIRNNYKQNETQVSIKVSEKPEDNKSLPICEGQKKEKKKGEKKKERNKKQRKIITTEE